MSRSCADWQLAFWKAADGELEAEEAKGLVEHLRACGLCRAAARQASRTHRILLESAVEGLPTPRLRISRRRPVIFRRSWGGSALVGAAALLVGVGLGYFLLRGDTAPKVEPQGTPPAARVRKPPAVDVAPAPRDHAQPVAPGPAPKPEPEPAPRPPEPVAPPPKPPDPAPPSPRPPDPAPPAPQTPTRPPEQPRETEVAAATIEKVEGEAFLVVGTQRSRAAAGGGLAEGQSLAVGPRGTAWLIYPDKTRARLAPDTEVQERGGPAKRLHIVRGTVSAEVARQPAGKPMVFGTPHGDATVLGTILRLIVDPVKTRLEVTEGKVNLSRPDGKALDVASGQYAVAATGMDLAVKTLPREGKVHLAEDFEDPRKVNARWILQENSFPVSFSGKAVFDVTRGKDPRGTGVNWTVATGGIQARDALRVPFRVSLDVEGTGGILFPWVRFLPAPLKKNSKRMISIERRPPQFELRVVDDQGRADSTTFGRKPEGAIGRERWMIEVDAAEIVVWVDGEERDRLKHGLTLAPAYFVALGASAQPEVPKDTKVEFDDVVLDLLKD